MTLFRMKWLRRFVRKHTKPISLDTAARNKQRLSLLYMFFAWNAVGFIAYSIMTKGKSNWAVFHNLEEQTESPAQNYAKLLKIDNARVIRFSGLKKEEDYEIARDTVSEEMIRKQQAQSETSSS